MTKSSVSQDESLLLPPESREPCRKPAASAGEVSVFCSCCCTSPKDCGSEHRPLSPGPGPGRKHVCTLPPRGTDAQPRGALTGGEARCEVELLLELLPEPELGYEGTGTGGAVGNRTGQVGTVSLSLWTATPNTEEPRDGTPKPAVPIG